MATAHLLINGTDYELTQTWEDESDPTWQSFRDSAESFFQGGSEAPVMDFMVKIKGRPQTLTVRLGGVATIALWLGRPSRSGIIA